MKKSLVKNNLKAIIKTRRRFFSILVMAFLGVGFFAGLVATSPDMLASLDKYARQNKMQDINIISTLGLTDDDIEALNKLEQIDGAYGIKTKDSITKIDEKEKICKVIEYNENINLPSLINGNMPQNNDECLLDEGYVGVQNPNDFIGKTIVLENEDKDEDENPIFTKKEFKIVGIVESPLYISNERGNTSIGSGNISYFIYVKDGVINTNYYTEIGVKVSNANNVVTNSDDYISIIENAKQEVENIKEQRQDARYNELVNKAQGKLNDATQEYNDQKQKVENELNEADTKIKNAKQQIATSEAKLQKSEKELSSKEQSTKKQFVEAEDKIEEAKKQIQTKSEQLQNAKQELEKNTKQSQEAISKLDDAITTCKNSIQQLNAKKQALIQANQDTTKIDAIILETQNKQKQLESSKNDIETKLNTAKTQITNGETEINKANQEIQNNEQTLKQNKSKAESQIKSAKQEIQKGKEKIKTAKSEILENEQKLETSRKEANEKLEEAKTKLNDAKDEISKIEKAKWYIQDRKDNTGYTNIFDAIKTMSNISKMFPLIFYLVAVLISLTSMTRMIEEERIEIGTLKSLGYTNLQIISKYVLYAFLACVIGGVLGMTVGFYLLPNIVWILYSMIYTIPKFYATYQIGIGMLGILIAFICIGGATIIVAVKELKQMPAVLMRPKPPKNGKRIFLERIKFIWKKLNFSKKVTMRNIFRYKKRAVMTIVGIAGCTGLMLTGFGIKDSVIGIPDSQFGGVFKYDSSVMLQNTEGLEDLKNYINSNENIESYVEIDGATGKLKNENANFDVTMFIPNDKENFKNAINLIDTKTNENVELSDNGIIITDKVAEFLKIGAGDNVTLVSSDDIEYNFKVDYVVKNYVSHYVYMSKQFYETNIKTYKTNMIYINNKDITDEQKSKMSEEILNIKGVSSVNMISDMMKMVSDMLNTMNYVVVILIVASALLAFVVLYNLANINIAERQREIATLKVLGFYNKEVDNYINKENIIFTIIGVVLGLVFGTFLTDGIIASVEIDKLRFLKNIEPISYVYSAAITILFSLIVNAIIHFILKKIDMIESLKSVE